MLEIAEYRSRFYSNQNRETYDLRSELNSLNQELAQLQSRTRTSFPMIPHNNFFELDKWFMDKLLLIGGCIAIGALLAYIFIGNKRR